MIQAINAAIQFPVRSIALEQNLIPVGITQQFLQQRFNFGFVFFDIRFKCEVNLTHSRDKSLFHAEIITNEHAYIVIRANLNFIPVFLVKVILLLGRQAHKNKVSDFITLTQSYAGRVQTFKN